MRIFQWFVAIGLLLLGSFAQASQCSNVLATGVQTIHSSGEMDLVTAAARIYNVPDGWRFNFPTKKDYNDNIFHCYQQATNTPPRGSAEECLLVASWQAQRASLNFVSCSGCTESYHIYENQTRDFTGSQNKFASLTQSANSSVTLGGFSEYFFDNLTLYTQSTLYIPGGSDVYINNNVALDGEIVVTGSGTVKLFINGSLYVYENSPGINASGSPEQLVILASGNVTIDGGTINGSIIQDDGDDSQKKSFTIQRSPLVRGLISADGNFRHAGGDFIIDGSALNADFGSVCDSTAPETFTLSGKLNVDNHHDVYISTSDTEQGVWITGSTKWTQTNTFSQELEAGQTYYLHVHGENTGDIAGFLGEFTISGGDHVFSNGSNRVLTNGVDWSVSNTGWGNYVSATVINGSNGVQPWGSGFTGSVDANAEWIWSSDPYNHNEAYFTIAITPTTEPVPTLHGRLNVDNTHNVYISEADDVQGEWVLSGDNWRETDSFSYELEAGKDYYIHVQAENWEDISGFLGEFNIEGSEHQFSNGTTQALTNTDWGVSTTGWGNYEGVTVINGANGVGPWGSFPTIDSNAQWIWTDDPYNEKLTYFTLAIEATNPAVQPIDISITSLQTHALTCEGIEVTVKILRGGAIDKSYQGTISLSSSSVTGLWGDEDGSLKGTLSATANGVASYQFSSSDQGIIVLNYQNPESGTTTLSAIADTAQDEVGPLEFAPSGYEITFDKGRLPYQVANQSFTLAVTAVEQSATDPLACVPIRNYEGLKELSFSVTYGQINGVDRAGTVELTVGGQAFPVDRVLRFQGGRSLPLASLNYKDVGPITIQVQEKVAEFPENGKLKGQASTTVVPKELAIVAVSDLSCNTHNPAGTASSGGGFVAAGDEFTIMTAGLIANCSVPGTVTACDAQTALEDVGNCIAPSFNEVVQLSASKDTPAAGVLGSFTGSMELAVDAFNNGYAAPVDYQYAEVGSVNLTASMANFLGTGIGLSDSTVIGRFYPDHYLMDEKMLTTPCEGSMLYMGSDEPHLVLEFTARNALVPSGITTNYDPNKGYTLASTPKVYLIDADGGRDLSDRLVFNAGSLPNWQSGQVLFDSDFLMTRLGEPDGSYPALDLGLVAKGHDDEAFADLDFDCGEECDGVTLGTLNNVRYGRLVASNGYSPQGQTLHIPFLLEYWNGSKFVQNSEDSCSVLSLDMMSFNPDTYGSDELNVGTGTSQVRLTSNWEDYERSVTASKGTFWLRFSSPGTTGVVTYFMGIGGDSAPSENWLPWLKYDWDGNGSDDESISGIATFGTQRGSDRIISRREL